MNKISINDIAGYEKEKEELIKIIEVLQNKKELFNKGGYIPKGLILYGPPGNGKTLFAKVLASSTNIKFYEFDASKENVCQRLKKLFKIASRKEQAIIFIDEIDRLLKLKYTKDTPEKVISVLASLIDGYASNGRNSIFVVGTTNDYDYIPEAIIRPGRIDKKIFIDRPNDNSRKEIIEYYINQTECKFETNIERIVKLTNKFSSAAIKTLINECVIDSNDDYFVVNELLEKKVNEILNEDIGVDISKPDAIIIAYAELGRFVVARSLKNDDYILNINQKGSSSGKIFSSCNFSPDNDDDDYYDYDDEDAYEEESKNISEGSSIYSKNDIINAIMISMGAVASNIMFNRGPYTIDYYYIQEARSLIKSAIKCGFYGFENCTYIDLDDEYSYDTISETAKQKYESLINEILKDSYDKARSIVKNKREVFKVLLSILIAKKTIDSEEAEPLVKDYFKKMIKKKDDSV